MFKDLDEAYAEQRKRERKWENEEAPDLLEKLGVINQMRGKKKREALVSLIKSYIHGSEGDYVSNSWGCTWRCVIRVMAEGISEWELRDLSQLYELMGDGEMVWKLHEEIARRGNGYDGYHNRLLSLSTSRFSRWLKYATKGELLTVAKFLSSWISSVAYADLLIQSGRSSRWSKETRTEAQAQKCYVKRLDMVGKKDLVKSELSSRWGGGEDFLWNYQPHYVDVEGEVWKRPVPCGGGTPG